MSDVNVGMHFLSCGCLLNTSLLPNGKGWVDYSPCKETCVNISLVMGIAKNDGIEVTHLWDA